MKARYWITSAETARHALRELSARISQSLAGGHSVRVVFEDSNRATEAMRARFHAMCDDIARALPVFQGARMDKLRWKAVIIGAHLSQEWLPGIDGHAVPYRPSSEEISREQYAGLIDVARMFGDAHGVAWTYTETPEPQR